MDHHNIPNLSPDRLAQMVDVALGHSQEKQTHPLGWGAHLWDFLGLRSPALRAGVAMAALFSVLAISYMDMPQPTTLAQNTSDAFSDINDLMAMDLLENLS
jgi:hypothetical protein